MSSEQIIIDQIKRGNRAAMKTLYTQYSGYATATCMRYVTENEAVKDILQDSFVKILTSIDRFEYRGEGSLKAWIRTLVANLALDYLRKNNRLCFTDDIPQEMEDEPPSMDEIPTEELLKMIGMLPIGYRTVLNLYVFEDKSHKEIAQILGIKENSSASQYVRAKKMLNKMMQNYMKGMAR